MSSHASRTVTTGVAFLLVLGLLTALPAPALAAPYVGADIVLDGSDFSAASTQWNVDGTAIWSNVSDEWAEYTVDLTAGLWQVGVEATNEGALSPDPWWYPQYELTVSLSSLTTENLYVQASDSEVHHGFMEYHIPTDGTYTVRFTWLNDQAENPLPGGGFEWDANIRIERVFFDEVPDFAPGQWFTNPANGHAYALTEHWATFDESEAQAVSWGGHLVTVNDQAEQDWLYETFGAWHYLIGLNDIDTEGAFVWVSGEPVSYTNWCRGEPNDYLGEDSVSMVGSAQCWNDIPGGGAAIVEVDNPPQPQFNVAYDSYPAGGEDFLHLYGWMPGSTLTISIDDPGTGPGVDHEVGSIAVTTTDGFNVDIGPDFDIQAGHEVTVTDGVVSMTHMVTNLRVTDADPVTDVVSGIGEFGKSIYVGSHEDPLGDYWVDPAPDGTWSVDMSGDDLRPGYGLISHQYDEFGNNTQFDYQVAHRHFKVHHGDDFVAFAGWVPDATLTVSIDDPATGVGADYEIGDISVPHPDVFDIEFGAEFDVRPGHEVTVSDGTYSLTHVVRDLVITSADPNTDLVTGIANPGETVVVLPSTDEGPLTSVFVDPAPDGSWQADLSDQDLQLGMSIEASQYEDLPAGSAGTGHFYGIPLLEHPTFTVFMGQDFATTQGIVGFSFLPSSNVTITIDLGADGSIDHEDMAIADEAGDVEFDTGPLAVQEGDVVTLTDDLDPPRVKSHVVEFFTVTDIDVAADIVAGTGRPGTELDVRANEQGPDVKVVVDGTGAWTADFSGIHDIGPGTGGWAQTDDSDGDHTQINWWAPLPEFGQWIHNPATGHYYALTDYDLSFSEAEGQARSWDGHLVTVDNQAEQDWLYETFGANPFWIGMNDVDTEGDWVWTSGTPVTYTNWCDGEPNDHDPGEDAIHYGHVDPCWNDVPVDANTAGIVEVETVESVAHIEQNFTHGHLSGNGWPIGAVVTITIDDPETPDLGDYQTQATVEGEGAETWFQIDTFEEFGSGFDLRPGLIITVTDGITAKTLVVADLAVTEVDAAADTISGTADPDVMLEVAIVAPNGYEYSAVLDVVVEGSGQWTANFAGLYDLFPGSPYVVFQRDTDGDATFLNLQVPLPDPGTWIHNPATGNDYALTDFDLSFSDAQAQAQSWGGHLVTVDDQAEQDWLYETFGINPFWIGLNDVDIEGSFVWTSGEPTGYTNWCDGEPNDAAEPPGEDAVHYGYEDPCWNDVPVDTNTAGIVELDSTPTVPIIEASITMDSLGGTHWPAGSTVTITMDDPDTPEPVDHEGQAEVTQYGPSPLDTEFQLDLQIAFEGQYEMRPGQIFTVTDGTTTKVLEIADLSVTDADAESGIVTGTAEPGTAVAVTAFAEFTEPITLDTTATGSGIWEADFGGAFDLGYSDGIALQADADGDTTEAWWKVPAPHFEVDLWFDTIIAREWPPGATLQLTVANSSGVVYESTSVSEQAGEDFWETEGFFDLHTEFDLAWQQTVTVSDGNVTKTHLVRNPRVLEIDTDADTMSGTANPGSRVEVEARSGDRYGFRAMTPWIDQAWFADFSVDPPDQEGSYDHGTVDLDGNYWFAFREVDDDGDSTGYRRPQGAPGILAVPDLDVINIDATRLSPVTLTVESSTGDLLHETTLNVVRGGQAGDLGGFNFPDQYPFLDPPGFAGARVDLHGIVDLAPGQVITWSDIAYTVETVVTDLSITEVDVDTDIVSGTIDPAATGLWGAVQDFAAYAGGEINGNTWSMGYDSYDIAHDEVGIALVYDQSPFRTYTSAIWHLRPVIAELNLPTEPLEEGASVALSASFSDLEVPDAHSATVDWGDGSDLETIVVTPSTGPGSGGLLAGFHSYAEGGTYVVSLTVTDAGGNSHTSEGEVSVIPNDAPVASPDSFTTTQDTTLVVNESQPHRYSWSFGSYGTEPGEFLYPIQVDFDANGRIYVSDLSGHRILVFDAAGNYLHGWGSQGFGDGQFAGSGWLGPRGVAVDAAGAVVTTDYNLDRVQKFTSGGEFIASWASGERDTPYGIAADAHGNVFVSYQRPHKIVKFDPDLTPIAEWGTPGPATPLPSPDGQLVTPHGLAVDSEGNVYVADEGNHRIQIFTNDGEYVTQWGAFGTGDGEFRDPIDVGVDRLGQVYVLDEDNRRIQAFTAGGTYLSQWDVPGNWRGFGVDASGKVYVAIRSISGYDAHVQVYAPQQTVLHNDVDPDGDPFSAVLVEEPSHGALNLHPDGSFTYTPELGFWGTDTFTYEATDGLARSAPTSATIEILRADDDSDGVSDPIEDAAPNDGDGNGDGIPDSEQHNVASLPNLLTGEYVTLEAPQPLTSVTTSVPPVAPPEPVTLPVGLIGFTVDPIAFGGDLTVTLYAPPQPLLETYWKYGPTPDNPVDHWYEFVYDGTTGAEIVHEADRTVILLHFVDGARGDSDLSVNGRLVDPGGPGFPSPPIGANDDTYETIEDTSLTVDAPGVLGNDVHEGADILVTLLARGPDHGSLTLNADGSFTYAPEPDWYGTDSFTYVANDGQFDSNEATVTIEVAPVNDPPVGTATPVERTVQYSDVMAPISIAVDDIDSTAVTATAAGLPEGITLAGSTCDVPCELALGGTVTGAAGTYNAIVTLDDGDGGSTEVPVTIVVAPEDASIAFHGGNPVAVRVAEAGRDSGTFDLKVRVREAEPDTAPGDPSPGDLDLAEVAMQLVPVGPGSPADPIGVCERRLDSDGYDQELTVTCAFDEVPVNAYTLAVAVDGGYHTGAGEDVVVVYDPSLGYTTGGGSFLWPGTDDVVNFGYTMEYNKKGTKVKGSLLLIRHLADGSTYRVKSNALYGLALGEGDGFGWASFSGKSTYLDPMMPEPEGNHDFLVYVEDHGEGFDRFWIEMRDKDDVVIPAMSMAREAIDHAVDLIGGNLVVPR